jgi:hypothetical protein
MSRGNYPTQKPADAHTATPAVLPPYRRWILGVAIVMEAAWIVVLAVLAIAR